MDALLSIPALGYFLMPSLTTYSTSLNLLFFYMTWSTLVLSHSPLKVEVIGCLGIRALFFLIPSSLFLIFDAIFPSLAVGIKMQGASALPARTGGIRGARRGGNNPQWYQVVGLSLFNVCLSVALQAGLEILLTDVLHIRSALKITTTLPMPWSIAKDLLKVLLLREIIQYYAHRYILHAPKSNTLSKLHKHYHHSVTAPYSFVTHYDHPLPYLLWRFLPVYLPAIIFRLHLLTYLMLLSLTSLEETLTFSGYTTIPGILLGGIARRQDCHSESSGRGNFAPWGFLDWLHSTSIGKDVMTDVRDEASKHNVSERSSKAWDGAKESGKAGMKEIGKRRRSSRKA